MTETTTGSRALQMALDDQYRVMRFVHEPERPATGIEEALAAIKNEWDDDEPGYRRKPWVYSNGQIWFRLLALTVLMYELRR